MSDSKRLTVLKAICEHISETVTPANGYKHDLTDRVFRGRLVFSDSDPVPMVSVLENLNPDRLPNRAGEHGHQHNEAWVLLVQGWSKDDRLNPSDPAYELMADTKKALALLIDDSRSGYLLNGLIADLTIEPGTVRPPDSSSSRAFFWMRVILRFTEDVRDPYRL